MHFPVTEFVDALESPAVADRVVVYDVMDLWDDFVATPWGSADDERRLVARADALTAVSRALVQRWAGPAPTHLVPNAVDRAFLSRIARLPAARLYEGTPKRVLYMGSMGGSWFDWDLLRTLVTSLPDHRFVLLGSLDLPLLDAHSAERVRALAAELAALPHVSLAQEVSHDHLVPWLRDTDVGIIPFLDTGLTAAVSPLKVYEYLGAGAVVVQSGMPDIATYPGVRTARDPMHFVELVGGSGPTRTSRAELDAMAVFCLENTWQQRVEALDRVAVAAGAERARAQRWPA